MKPDSNYKLDDSIGYKLFHASRLMNNRINKYFKENEFPVTYEQWQILSRLYERDGLTQNQIAELNEKDQPSVSRLIVNMVNRGLVTRSQHPSDARINIINLTEQAKESEEKLKTIANQTIQDATKGIDPEDVTKCLRMLDQIRANLK
ncbi:MarR family winged helix-turn-helix transcriptional regulator [Sutcliffiella horikoshii]|uniref:MarR family winged helix-turn-helix transcriptional regulator n=1 Tax=Sutcliffiella horikoshii TaxID=79883 RepID=UPI001CBF79A4|nr:MarR family winged helix-turn-helix transcriptional regulator [Sutcliffiella horikoshii]UAL48643.1 MarR family winged helix-turn-helix transcriptional regulator [Sutcliffiella horikoshii]